MKKRLNHSPIDLLPEYNANITTNNFVNLLFFVILFILGISGIVFFILLNPSYWFLYPLFILLVGLSFLSTSLVNVYFNKISVYYPGIIFFIIASFYFYLSKMYLLSCFYIILLILSLTIHVVQYRILLDELLNSFKNVYLLCSIKFPLDRKIKTYYYFYKKLHNLFKLNSFSFLYSSGDYICMLIAKVYFCINFVKCGDIKNDN